MFIIKVLCIVLVVLGAFYLFLIMPRMTGRPDRKPHLGVLYAHRGLFDNASDAPENTMAAFRKAVDAGYGIECDVQLTKDNIPVIFHDFTLKRCARFDKEFEPSEGARNEDGSIAVPGKVRNYTLNELRKFHIIGSEEKIPTFEEFLKMVDGKVPLIIELKIDMKDTAICPIANRMLEAYKGIYCIESFNPLGLKWYKEHNPSVMRGQLSDQFFKEDPKQFKRPLYFVLTNLMFNFMTKPDFIAFNREYSRTKSLWLCRHLYGCTTAAWTIKNEQQLEQARKDFDIYIFDSFVPSKNK